MCSRVAPTARGPRRQARRETIKKGTLGGKECLIVRCRDQSQAWFASFLDVIRSPVQALERKRTKGSLDFFIEVRLSLSVLSAMHTYRE